MTVRSWSSEIARQEMARLTAPSMLGFFTHFEATEIFANLPGQSNPINVFSIFVAEERASEVSDKPIYLNPDRLKLKSLRDWSFGIKRYLRPINELVPQFDSYCTTNSWCPSGQPLLVGDLVSIPTQFVPPDSAGSVPWNRVLKNNFWNGSHVFEWTDRAKTPLKPFFDEPARLKELSDEIHTYVPIGLASLSDRLGNIVVQLPVTVLIAKFGEMRVSGDFTVTIAWHLKATPRPLRSICEMEYDRAISGFNSRPILGRETLLPMQDGQGMHRGVVWDDENHIVLAASGDMSFIKSIVLNLQVMGSEPRVFTVPDGKGGEHEIRVAVTPPPIRSVVGEPPTDIAADWTRRRMYSDETAQLVAQRRFVRYRPATGQQLAEHEKALNDLRFLIRQHGQEGAWIWDPYLSAEDLINTLFHCPFSGSDLRALSEGYIPPFESESRPPCVDRFKKAISGFFGRSEDASSTVAKFVAQQRVILDATRSNLLGLRLEFRVKTGSSGWTFHDRFLIFPPSTDRGALAWSLGTSVNGLGKKHHILQRAEDGQRIMDDFLELWSTLDKPEHLVWKKP
jgi:hypothetical protein